MSQGSNTLLHPYRVRHIGSCGSEYGSNSTKECRNAAVTVLRDDSMQCRSSYASHSVAQEAAYAALAPNMPGGQRENAAATSLPQHVFAAEGQRERLHPSLPQRPEPAVHMPLPRAGAQPMKPREVCQNFLKGRCQRGDRCHRIHPKISESEGGQSALSLKPQLVTQPATRNEPASKPTMVRSEAQVTPLSPTTSAYLEGVYVDRFGVSRTLDSGRPDNGPVDPNQKDGLSTSQATTARQQERRSTALATPQPQEPPSVLPERTLEKSVLYARSPARTIEDDTRPARRTDELCTMYPKGLCKYGESCYKAHVLDVPPELLEVGVQQHTPNVQIPRVARRSVGKDGRELCKLNLVDKCRRGDSCTYSHDLGSPISRPCSPVSTPVAGPSRLPAILATPAAKGTSALPEPQTLESATENTTPSSIVKSPDYIVLPDGFCRLFIHGRCNYTKCKYRHVTREEYRAMEGAQKAAEQPAALAPASVHAQPLDASVMQQPSAQALLQNPECSPIPESQGVDDDPGGEKDSRPSSTAKKRRGGRRKKKAGHNGAMPQEQNQAEEQKTKDVNSKKAREPVKRAKEAGGETTMVVGGIETEKPIEVGRAVKKEKGKGRADPAPVLTETTTQPAKAKAATVEIKDEVKTPGQEAKAVTKHDVSVAKNAKQKGAAEKAPRDSAVGSPMDIKGKGKAKAVGMDQQDTQKGHNEPKNSVRSKAHSEKASLSPVSVKSNLAAANPSPSSASSGKKGTQSQRKSASQPVSPTQAGPSKPVERDSDTETDCSFHSAVDSRNVSAQTSWSSVGSSSAYTKPKQPKEPCWDYLMGRCVREVCRYSHDVDREVLDKPRPDIVNGVVNSTPFLSQPSYTKVRPLPQGSSMGTSAHNRPSAIDDDWSNEPSVPPGLGLEALVAPPGLSRPLNDAEENVTITVLDSTKVTFSSGFGIVKVSTGFECRQILLGNVPSTMVSADITTALAVFGEIVAVSPGDVQQKATSSYRVMFVEPESAVEAAAALDGSELFGSRVTARLAANKTTGIGGGTIYDGDVLFEIPSPRQTGYVGFETESQAEKAVKLANKKEVRGMWVTAKIYEGLPVVGMYNVRVEGLPADATAKDLAKYGKYESHMLERPKYQSLRGAIEGLRRMLLRHGEVTLNVLPPPYRKIVRIWAHFTDPQAAAQACEALHRFCPAFVGKQRIFAHHVQSLRYTIPAPFYDVLAYDIGLLHSFCQDDQGTSITIFDRRRTLDPSAPVLVKLVSHNKQALAKLKTAFDRLLRGEKVMEDGQIVWCDFFSSKAGTEFVRELERVHPKVSINIDPRRRTIALFGSEQVRAPVREEIISRARLYKARRKHYYPVPGDVVGVFLREHLPRLQKELGRESVWFDLTTRRVVACGSEDIQKVAQLAVQHARKHQRTRPVGDDLPCPVCLCDATHPITLPCGHRWCKDCLAGYLNASVDNKTFPLTCLADDAKCAQHIPLHIAQQLLTPEEFDAVAYASFLAYVQARPAEYRYCPTPDCPHVYRKTTRTGGGVAAVALQCPSCLIRICPHCDMEEHEHGSCQDRVAEDEALFDEWKRGHDVKDCPRCKVPIERMAGCNHMTCVSCKTHICWACLATFSSSQEVYDHMRAIHGGIGL